MVLATLIVIFILVTIIVNSCPTITSWDRELIGTIQNALAFVPLWIPTAFDGILYATMIIIPLLIAWIYFLKQKKYFDIAFLGAVPLITYGLSSILKHIVDRPRPPIELHLSVHPGGFSYVSSHTIISFCLWGMIIYYLINYCENKVLRNIVILISCIWMLAIGFSRIWLGVHNPTDVLSAYLLGTILLMIYIKIRKFFEKYIGL